MNSPSFVIYDVTKQTVVVSSNKPSVAIQFFQRPTGRVWQLGDHFGIVDGDFSGIVELPLGNILLGVVSNPESDRVRSLAQSFLESYLH